MASAEEIRKKRQARAKKNAQTGTDVATTSRTDVKVAYEPPGLKGFAQGRRQPNLIPEDFPDLSEIVDPGDDAPKTLSRDETELRELVIRSVHEFGLAHATTSKALAIANKGRLYRSTHRTFEAFAREYMDISRGEAYRRVDQAEITEILSPMGDKMIPVAQTRELAPLLRKPEQGPEAVRKVWEKASETVAGDGAEPAKPITAEVLKQVRDEEYPRSVSNWRQNETVKVSPTGDKTVEKRALSVAKAFAPGLRFLTANSEDGTLRLVADAFRSEMGEGWCHDFAAALTNTDKEDQ